MERGKGVQPAAVDVGAAHTTEAAAAAAAAAAAEAGPSSSEAAAEAAAAAEAGAAAAEEEWEEEERRGGSSSGSSSSSSWKVGLGALVPATGSVAEAAAAPAAASASAVVHFHHQPTPLACRPPRFLPSFQGSAALKSSWIKRLRGFQGDGEQQQQQQQQASTSAAAAATAVALAVAAGKEGKQIVQSPGSAPDGGGGSSRASKHSQQQQREHFSELQRQQQEWEGKGGGDYYEGTVNAAAMDSDTNRMRVFGSSGSGILAPGDRRPPVGVASPADVLASRRFGDDSAQQLAVRGGGATPSGVGGGAAAAAAGGETMILSRRAEAADASRPPPPPASSKAMDVGRMEPADTDSHRMSGFMQAARTSSAPTAAPKVTFAPSTKDSSQERSRQSRKRPLQDGEHQGWNPFRFSQMDNVLEDATAAPQAPTAAAAAAASGFGIFRLNASSSPAQPMGPPTKRPALAGSMNGMGSFAFSAAARSSVPPSAAGPVAPLPLPVPGQPSSAPGPAGAVDSSVPPSTSAELTVWTARPEKKPSFQLLKFDITKEEETERLQRRNGQLLESMLANRHAEKEKELFGSSARAGGGPLGGLPPRSSTTRPDGSSFVSYVKKLQSDGASKASTSYQPGAGFDGVGPEGSMSRDGRPRGGRMRQVFQDTEPGDAKPSQRHADTLSRLWQGIADQPSLLTPVFAPYQSADEGLGNPRGAGAGNDFRGAEEPSPLTPLFSPFKYPQDDGSQARRMDRPPLPSRVDSLPSSPFTFTATGRRPSAASPSIPPPSGPAGPKDVGKGVNQQPRADGIRGSMPTASQGGPNRFESHSSHHSNSPWPLAENRFGVYEEARSRSNVQVFGDPSSRPSASGAVRGPRLGLDSSDGLARSQIPSDLDRWRQKGPANREQGGPSTNPRTTPAWVPEAMGQPPLQRYNAEPGDSSGSTPPLLPPETGLGMKYAGFRNLVSIEPLIVPSQSLQAGDGESESQIPSASKVPKIMMDMPPEVSRRGRPLDLRAQGLAGGNSRLEGQPGQPSAGGHDISFRPGRRNVLNEVDAEGPSYVSSRALHSSKPKTIPAQPTMPDGGGEDGDQAPRPRLLQTWINRWLPANSALPSCQPSNSKSAARPAEGPRTNSAQAPQHTMGNVRHLRLDQSAGARGQGTSQDRGRTGGDYSGGFESGRDRWFHARPDGVTASGSGPSAAAMAIVGRAMRNLSSTSPLLWRQGTPAVRPTSDSQQASASGHSEHQPR